MTDDILRRWERACEFYWDETSSRCSSCGTTYCTGDVCLVFGDMDTAAARKDYDCELCGYRRVIGGDHPSAISIFIENEHRDQKLTHLPQPVIDRLKEAFGIVDRFTDAMEALVERHAGRLN